MATQSRQKVVVSDIARMKKEGRKIVAVTAYDFPTALIADAVGVDFVLVGDSGGMVVLGRPDTRGVTMEEMLVMASAVSRGAKRPLLVGDMPFMSFQDGSEPAVRNAGRFVKEAGMDAVKIEGGREFASTVKSLTRVGIPVLAHIGFTPQTTPTLEGYRVQGKTVESAMALLEDATALEEAGAFAIVLEMMTSEVARMITEKVSIPTIGIGAGAHTDGQILVLHDMIGLFNRFTPKFARRYLDASSEIARALTTYREEVSSGKFPGEENTFHIDPSELQKFNAKMIARR